MSAVVDLDGLLRDRRLWRGRPSAPPPGRQPTGLAALDAILPEGGWPDAALSEILLPADGVGELELILPTLARLAAHGGHVVLVAPPYLPYAPAWQAAGVRLDRLTFIEARGTEILWAMEQCLRSGACAAVLGWPGFADDRSLRKLQVAATTGQALGFVFRARSALDNPSPAALRLEIEAAPARLRVHKCRGANPPRPIVFARA